MILKDFNGGVIKLHEGDDPRGLFGLVLKEASPHTNAGKMSARVVVSAETVDRDRDQVVLKGMDLTDHAKNPVVLLNHNRELPVGYAEDRLGNYTVRRDGGRLVAETFFSQSTELGEQAFRLVESKVLRGASVGFLPGLVEKSSAGGRLFKTATMVEYSHVVVPSHQDCLVTAVEKGFGGKKLCDPLLALLTPYVLPRPATVTSGWENTPAPAPTQTVEKGLTDMDEQKDPNDEFAPPEQPVEGADDPNAPPVDDVPAEPHHSEVVSQSLESAGMAILSAYHKGELGGDEALDKLTTLFDTHDKLTGAGGDEQVMNLDDDDEEFGKVDDDEEDDDKKKDDDEYEEKAFYTNADAAVVRKAYAFVSGILTSPSLQPKPGSKRFKRLNACAKALLEPLGSIQPVVQMVKKSKASDWSAALTRLDSLETVVKSITER